MLDCNNIQLFPLIFTTVSKLKVSLIDDKLRHETTNTCENHISTELLAEATNNCISYAFI